MAIFFDKRREKMIGYGRRKIIDDREINEENIIQILIDAFSIHRQNVNDMKYLINYYKGKQDILHRDLHQVANPC